MKRRMGFTLVELMGILVVLALILIVTVPSITKTFQSTEKNKMDIYKDSLCDAARTYVNLARDQERDVALRNQMLQLISTNGREMDFTAAKLIEAGYLPDNIKNPKKGSTPGTTIVTLKNNGGKIECISFSGI